MRCFDITCLSYDRFCQDKRAKAKKKLDDAEKLKEQEKQNQALLAAPKGGSSLDEWMEKLKVVFVVFFFFLFFLLLYCLGGES